MWICEECTTRYAKDLSACPHCRSGQRFEEHDMGKNSRLRGPTTIDDIPAPEPETVSEADAEPEIEVEQAPAVEAVEEEPESSETAEAAEEPEPEDEPDPDPEDGNDDEDEDEVEPLERPAGNALTSTWADYVHDLGYDGTTTGKTRAELVRIADRLEADEVDG